jgi:hypothetical protein
VDYEENAFRRANCHCRHGRALDGSASAAPIPLSDLLVAGATLESGDKIFSDFSYRKTGDMPGPENLVVEAFTLDGDFGIRISGGFVDQAGGDSSDAVITFNVSVAQGSNMTISGATLAANPAVFGGTGLASVTETFLPVITNDKLVVYDFGGGNDLLLDSLTFPTTYTTLPVQKDITLYATGGAGAATMSFVDQVFSQVPEPASWVLLTISLVCLRGVFCRRRS